MLLFKLIYVNFQCLVSPGGIQSQPQSQPVISSRLSRAARAICEECCLFLSLIFNDLLFK